MPRGAQVIGDTTLKMGTIVPNSNQYFRNKLYLEGRINVF